MERRKKFLIFRDGREGEEEKKSPKKTSTLRRGKRNFFLLIISKTLISCYNKEVQPEPERRERKIATYDE